MAEWRPGAGSPDVLEATLQKERARRAEAERLLRAMVEQMPAVVYTGDADGDLAIRYISPQVEVLTGVPPVDWTSGHRSWTAQIFPEDRLYVLAAYRQMRATAMPLNIEYRIYARDGRQVWIHHRAHVVAAEPGRKAYVQGLLLDISDRRLVEDALRESELRYRTLVETSPDSITVTDLDGRILMANQQARELYGMGGRAALAGRSLYEFVAPEDRAALAAGTRRVLSQDRPERVAYGALNDLRGLVPAELTLTAIRDAEGQPIALMGVSRDISERLEAAAARRESEEKSRFLATMSHELRTPLNSILGFTQLLSSGTFGELDPRQARYLGHIDASGHHLLSLVNDILDLSQVAAGQVHVARQSVRIAGVLEETLIRSRPALEAKGIELVSRPAEGLSVQADPGRLIQVLSNLLSNAIKFTATGGRVELAAHREGEFVLITVADNGIGIPPDQQEEIFKQFFQVESGRARKQDGTGLGLALSRRLTELMGGSIGLVSEVGRGSAFTVRLAAAAYDLSGDGDPDPGTGHAAGDGTALRS